MAARDSTGLIIKPVLPSLTTTTFLYGWGGQSNSDGVATLQMVNTSDPTMGACRTYGRDGRQSRDGSTLIWTDMVSPGTIKDFTGLANSEIQEPCRAYGRECAFFEVLRVLNQRQIRATGQRHKGVGVTFGQTGYTLAQLVKGTPIYSTVINGMTQAVAAETALGGTPIIPAFTFVQGEADFAASGSGWAAGVAQLQSDLETDLKAITGQSQGIPLFIGQQSNFCEIITSVNGILYPVLDQLAAHIANPGKVILLGPMYAGESLANNNFHFFGHQEVRWAHGWGNIMADVLIDGKTGNPIRVKSITRSGNVLTVVYYVPSLPLVLDTSYVTQLVDGNYGFDYRQTGGSAITITNIALVAPDTMQVTLSAAPDGTSPIFRAGRNSANTITKCGPREGARTCLRDSANALPQYSNWCCHEEVAVP